MYSCMHNNKIKNETRNKKVNSFFYITFTSALKTVIQTVTV